MSTRTYERRGGRHRRRPQPDPRQFDEFATGIADAVERLVRAFDPAERPGLGDLLAGDAETTRRDRFSGRCGDCGRDSCSGKCHDDRCGGCGRGRCCGKSHDGRCAPRCEPCDCHCDCCIGDVDVVVYARVGETRVIPVQLENHRKRERDITVQLAEFRTKGGGATGVVGTLVGPSSFTLAPCSEREVVIGIRVGGEKRDPQATEDANGDLAAMTKAELLDEAERVGAETTSAMRKEEVIDAITESSTGREPVDVDDCHVAVADLCIEGCDSRPVRIAVAVLPRDCNSYTVRCECACC